MHTYIQILANAFKCLLKAAAQALAQCPRRSKALLALLLGASGRSKYLAAQAPAPCPRGLQGSAPTSHLNLSVALSGLKQPF